MLDEVVRSSAGGVLSAEKIRRSVGSLLAAQRESNEAINLVPSENRLSPLARLPLQTDFYNRYFFNDSLDPSFWQFRGAEEVSRFETGIALPALGRLAAAEHVNLRPISGLSAMMIGMGALGGDPGGVVVSIDHECGGHYATTSVAARLGFVPLTVPLARGAIDLAALRSLLRAAQVRVVYADLQNSLYPLEVAPVARLIAEESPGTLFHVDSSHVMGLVLGGAVANPLDEGADSFGGSTHKSFPGPQKGVLFTRRQEIWDKFRATQFFLLSSHHFAETVSLGLAAAEFEVFGAAYARQVLENAAALAWALREDGFEVVGDDEKITRTHQIWLRVGDDSVTNEFSGLLYHGGIRVNIQTDLPGISGAMLRLGVSELSFQGAGLESMALTARAFRQARDRQSGLIAGTRREIRQAFGEPFYYTEFAT